MKILSSLILALSRALRFIFNLGQDLMLSQNPGAFSAVATSLKVANLERATLKRPGKFDQSAKTNATFRSFNRRVTESEAPSGYACALKKLIYFLSFANTFTDALPNFH